MDKMLQLIIIYRIMFNFLENYYYATHLDDIGSLLGDMQILEDNKEVAMHLFTYEQTAGKGTMDPAIWDDWLDAVGDSTKQKLDIKEGYDAVIKFLCAYADRLESEEIKEFIQQLTFEKWCAAFEEVSKKECMKLTKEESISH